MHDADIQLIEQYLLGQLHPDLRNEVEKRLLHDEEFARELRFQEDLFAGIARYGDEKIKARLAAVDQQLAESGFFSGRRRLRRYLVGLGLVLLTGLVFLAFRFFLKEPSLPSTQPAPSPGPKERIATPQPDKPIATITPKKNHPSKYLAAAQQRWILPEPSMVRAAGNTADSLALALEWLHQNEFDKVKRMLAPVATDSPDDWASLEIYAHACFLSGDIDGATKQFSAISESRAMPFAERADWYLLLCTVARLPRQKDLLASRFAQILSDEGHPYFDNARELERRLMIDDLRLHDF